MLTLLFAGAFYWFYAFMTEKMVERLRIDMNSTLLGAADGVDVDELISLYQDGEPNAEGFSDDPRYIRQIEWLDTIHRAEPEMWLYTFIIDTAANNRRMGPPAVPPDQLETIYLVDLWAKYDPTKAVKFLESDTAIPRGVEVLQRNMLVEHPVIYTDKWGTWLSSAAPLTNAANEVVAIIGLDVEADYVFQLQNEIRNTVLFAFFATYSLLFVILYVTSDLLTRYLHTLSQQADAIAKGDYQTPPIVRSSAFVDELDHLAKMLETMKESIRIRESLILESIRSEHDIQIALQRERHLNELKSEFISLVSHEFRTPLTVIRTSAELLDRYTSKISEEKQRDYFQRIHTAVRNISNLIDDILTIGQAETGKLEVATSPIHLEHFCIDLIQEIHSTINAKNRITFQTETNLFEAHLDPKLLRSILLNLLSNAIKYSSASSSVILSLSGTEENVTFDIKDHGMGIPEVDQPHLFELFHRGSNVSNISGVGLGLAITKQCVDLLQGTITFSSDEENGTIFSVVLPRHLNFD
ncbi:MAG: HAMP domain-containing sensor histidine kinase [Leptolyngbyaceae bacterium]|nr:HAMP domain-containing sensor histidine kinase [Leptolyngbyaceae bacterium]